jgi:uncharacterized protein YpmS
LPGFLALTTLLSGTLACKLTRQTTQIPEETIPVSTEAVESLEQEILKANQDIQNTGEATLVIDETELTSLVAFELQSQETPFLRDPQIYLRDGRILMVGNLLQGETTAPVELVLTVAPNAEGRPAFEIVSAKIGPLPLPDTTIQQFSKELNDAFTSTIDPRMEDIFIDTIVIADGRMTIQGHTR